MSSPSAIADALKTMFGAASAFGSDFVTVGTYDVLDRASASCMVINWTGYRGVAETFGDPPAFWQLNDFELAVFLKDTGDPFYLTRQVLTAASLVQGTLTADDLLQGTIDALEGIAGKFTPNRGVQSGAGVAYLPIIYNITTRQF